MRHRFLVFLLLSLSSLALKSQSGLGTWNLANLKIRLDNRWSVFAEPQLRSLSFYNQFHYYELKAGGGFKVSDQFSLGAGVGSYNTFQEGGNFVTPMRQREVRTWLQVSLANQWGRLEWEHRYRAEQRFTNNGYRNRFRYRLSTTVPLNRKEVEPGAFYLSVWDEIFFTDRAPYFERNRIFAGLGYEATPFFAFQMGYLHQFDYRLTDETGRDFLQVSLLFQLDLRKGEEQQHSQSEQ
jgi:hypothetical protein